MKFKTLLLSLGVLCTLSSFAQETASVEDKLHQLTLSVIVPSLQYSFEKKLTDKSVMAIKAGITMGEGYSSTGFVENNFPDAYFLNESIIMISPMVDFGYKNYYNLQRRADKGKNVSNNSGNYFGVSLIGFLKGYSFHTIKRDYYQIEKEEVEKDKYFDNQIGVNLVPKWGINRYLGNKFSYYLDLGPSVGTDFEKFKFGLHLHTGFSLNF